MTIVLGTNSREAASRRRIFLSLAQRIWAAAYRYYRRRATERALSRLDDHVLKDIGLTRTATGYEFIVPENSLSTRRRRTRL